MASAEKCGNSYRITASCGLDSRGKQIKQQKTFTADPKMTERQIKKELEKVKVEFEKQCKEGYNIDNSQKIQHLR